MAKKKNDLIVPLGIVAVIAAVWYFSRDNTAAAAALPGGTVPGTPGAIPGTVSTTLSASTSIAQQGAPASTAGSGIASSQDLIITNWFDSFTNQAEKANAYAQLPNMTTDEKNQMANIIVNVWMKGVAPTAQQTDFWNTWRVKYHIDDGTFA